MNPIIEQITLEEELEKFADSVAEDIYKEFEKFHRKELKMTKYQAAMVFCKFLKSSLYMKLVNKKLKIEDTLSEESVETTQEIEEIKYSIQEIPSTKEGTLVSS